MAETTIVSSTTITQPTGSARQAHVIYAANSGRWWLFYLSAASTLATLYSTDGVTWTAGATSTLSASSSTGGEIAVAYANIASTDVVHISHSPSGQVHEFHNRATISGTTITFSSWTQYNAASGGGNGGYDAAASITSGGYIGAADNAFGDGNTTTFPNADSGTLWTVGTPSNTVEWSAQNSTFALALLPHGTNGFLFLCDDGTGLSWGGASSYAVQWGTYNGTSWSTAAAISGYTKTSQVPNDWGACKVSDTDFHLVHRTGSNTYEHLRYNGTSWSAGQSIPSQTSLAGAGFALVSDGTSVWMFVIDSAAGNAVKYIKWSSSAWGSWQTLESTSATRSYISVCPQVNSGTLQVIWTEGSASPYAIAGEQLSTGGGGGTVSLTAGTANASASTTGATLTLATALAASTANAAASATASTLTLAVALAAGTAQASASAAAATLSTGNTVSLTAGAATASASTTGATLTLATALTAATANASASAPSATLTLAVALTAGVATAQASAAAATLITGNIANLTAGTAHASASTTAAQITLATALLASTANARATTQPATFALAILLAAQVAQATATAGIAHLSIIGGTAHLTGSTVARAGLAASTILRTEPSGTTADATGLTGSTTRP